MVPEDSMLRRHYLTELKTKQQSTFDVFLNEVTKSVPPPARTLTPDGLSDFDKFKIFATAFVIFSLLIFIF